MVWLRMLVDDVGGIAWGNRWWMSWNALLALVPALFAVHLFRPGRRTGPLWVVELIAFVLFLPNALLVLFVVIWLGHAVTRALATEASAWCAAHAPERLRSA